MSDKVKISQEVFDDLYQIEEPMPEITEEASTAEKDTTPAKPIMELQDIELAEQVGWKETDEVEIQ